MRRVWLGAMVVVAAMAGCKREAAPPPTAEGEGAGAVTTPEATPPAKGAPATKVTTGQEVQPAGRRWTVKDETAETCVGSKNSNAFHRVECEAAQPILPKNLVVFKNREEAIAAGRVACGACRP